MLVTTEQQSDGTWRASRPGADWSTDAATEDAARDAAVQYAIDAGDDPNEAVRFMARNQPAVEPVEDDPRRGWVWAFTPLTEQLPDGTWRASFASGGWHVTGASKEEAVEKANRESLRRSSDPDEFARKTAVMRRHLSEPVPGVRNYPSSVLDDALRSANPTRAVAEVIDRLQAESEA